MSTTIEFIRKQNRKSVGLKTEWLSRLQLVAESGVNSNTDELVFVESPDVVKQQGQRLDTPEVGVKAPVTTQAKYRVVGSFVAGELPDTSIAPLASPEPQQPGKPEELVEKASSQPSPGRPSQVQQDLPPAADQKASGPTDLDIVDLQDFADINLRVDQSHHHAPAKTRIQPARTTADAAKDVKRIADQLLKQYPPVAPAVFLFVSSECDARHRATVRSIAMELAMRSEREILAIDAGEKSTLPKQKGLAEVVNRNASIDNVTQETELDNLKFMNAGEGELTIRRTRPATLTKMVAGLRKQFQYTCIAAPEINDMFTKTISRYCDVTYLIVDLSETDQKQAKTSVDLLRRAGARLGGCIVRERPLQA